MRLALLLIAVALVVVAWLPEVGLVARWERVRARSRRALVEDALKYLHATELRGTPATPESLAGHLHLRTARAIGLVAEMEARGLVRTTGHGIAITSTGRETAVRIIRAHRLLERYFADELRMPLEAIHTAADRREHRVTPAELAELDARLGYPTRDPHGDPIPGPDGQLPTIQGTALTELPVGQPAVVVHLEDEPPELYRQLVAAGLEPGMRIERLDTSAGQLVVWDGDHELILTPVAGANVFVTAIPEPASAAVRLTALEPGRQGRVVALRAHGLARRRLLDLGITPGVAIECAFTSPFGEPTAFRVRGALVALRAEQASQIEVEPLGRAVA